MATPSRTSSDKKIINFLRSLAMNSSNRSLVSPAVCSSQSEISFCDDQPLYHILMGKVFWAMLLLCLLGNCMNLIIYHTQQMRRFSAVQMLSAKAVRSARSCLHTVITVFLAYEHFIHVVPFTASAACDFRMGAGRHRQLLVLVYVALSNLLGQRIWLLRDVVRIYI